MVMVLSSNGRYHDLIFQNRGRAAIYWSFHWFQQIIENLTNNNKLYFLTLFKKKIYIQDKWLY